MTGDEMSANDWYRLGMSKPELKPDGRFDTDLQMLRRPPAEPDPNWLGFLRYLVGRGLLGDGRRIVPRRGALLVHEAA